MSISNIISLLSGVAMFLFGMVLMGDSLKKVAGSKLELVLYRLSSTPLRGMILGTGVTAVIQSSCATSVMVVGFVNSGMMKFRQAIGVVMGSIIGTSITGWVICLSYLGGAAGGLRELLSTATLTGVIAVVGIILRMFCKDSSKHHIGDILMGFAILMFGMQSMSAAVSPLRENPGMIRLLTAFSNPFLGILVGAAFTAILQSASAAVGILQALSVTGAISFSAAFPLLMGIAIGASVPVLLSALGAGTDGKRTAAVYLVVEAIGVTVFGILYYTLNSIFVFPFTGRVMDPFSIAFVNSVFRIVKIGLLAPFIPQIEAFVCRLVPDQPNNDPVQKNLLELEERFIQHPALAVEQSRLTVCTMAQNAEDNLLTSFDLLEKYSDADFARVQELESNVDRFEDALGSYLVKITGQDLSTSQNKAVSKFLHTISDFERISDHAVNIADAAKELHEKGLVFSDSAAVELAVIRSAVSEIVHISIQAFIKDDTELATRVEPLEQLIDTLCDEMKLRHVDRLQKGQCTLAHGFIFNDLMTNYERVADHCSNIAVAIIELDEESFDTHEYLSSVKDFRSAAFEQYYEEYSRKYVI